LLAEDAIIIGRLNCDEFAMGTSNENSAYGTVLNDFDNTKVSGGTVAQLYHQALVRILVFQFVSLWPLQVLLDIS
jgi:hypothetical protein